jgi:NADH dehydrogenase [ubiquinone] 1 alpha subcomplex assembly factor 1
MGISTEQFLFEFSNPLHARGWHAVDDVVMGGVSRSEFRQELSQAAFVGNVSLEQNGGFCSVRSGLIETYFTGSLETGFIQDCSGLVIRVRGDGKKYSLRIRTDESMDGTSFEWAFEARERWDELRVPWTALTGIFRGQRVWFAPKFEPAKIRTVGFIISRQPGPFKLEVDWIKLWT